MRAALLCNACSRSFPRLAPLSIRAANEKVIAMPMATRNAGKIMSVEVGPTQFGVAERRIARAVGAGVGDQDHRRDRHTAEDVEGE